MQYIAFIRTNRESPIGADEWEEFFKLAGESGMFKGGSELGKRVQVGTADAPDSTGTIDGYMRFDTDELTELLALLEHHPCTVHGGTIEVRQMPQSGDPKVITSKAIPYFRG